MHQKSKIMMEYLLISCLITLILILFVSSCATRRDLYSGDHFTLTRDRVTEGEFQAVAISSHEIVSDYRSSYRRPTPRRIDFKFSINGDDNENYPGADHHFLLYSDAAQIVTPLYRFGAPDPEYDYPPMEKTGNFLNEDTDLLIRLDMRPVLADMKSKGHFELYTGQKISNQEFRGVYVAGSVWPLSWDFANLASQDQFQLQDPDGDGIFEITIRFKKYPEPNENSVGKKVWKLSRDISAYPAYSSDIQLSDALYNLSLEELLANIREDGAFMAGEKWPGVWTRDISYSILLALALVDPQAARISLRAKVKNDRIIQDTGTGGSWPVSSDRMIWALAAWEVYAVTGDREWLEYAYRVIRNSAGDDLVNVRNSRTGLMYGESSFLDWREQSYPAWMDPKDIYMSQCLGTNAVHYETYRILARMAEVLGEDSLEYAEIATGIREALNALLWLPDRNYYGQCLYGRLFPTVSIKPETLGEALCILFGIADETRSADIIANMPVTPFGPTCFFPQISNTPSYHNNGIWPFVTAYWTWAAAKSGNEAAVRYGMASVYRAAGLFLSNCENIHAGTGDFMGTEINSPRQLWSVAGNLALVYRVLFGMEFSPEGLRLAPCIPKVYGGSRRLQNFRYRNAELDITIDGFGREIRSVELDGKKIQNAFIPADVVGKHSILIRMANRNFSRHSINLVENSYAPRTPEVSLHDDRLEWSKMENDDHYCVYRNGLNIAETQENFFTVSDSGFGEFQVMAVDAEGRESFLSEPVWRFDPTEMTIMDASDLDAKYNWEYAGYSGKGYISITESKNNDLSYRVPIKEEGDYVIRFRYANGAGPINTSNKCAIRSLFIDGDRVGGIILPQRGMERWDDWGFSNYLRCHLNSGIFEFRIKWTDADRNMNGEENRALIDRMEIIRLADRD